MNGSEGGVLWCEHYVMAVIGNSRPSMVSSLPGTKVEKVKKYLLSSLPASHPWCCATQPPPPTTPPPPPLSVSISNLPTAQAMHIIVSMGIERVGRRG